MTPWSPSDLGAAELGQTLRLSGRVSFVGALECEIADACSAQRVVFAAAPGVSPGDLVVVEGRYDTGVLSEARLVSRVRCAEPRGDSDIARFTWQGVGKRLVARARALGALRSYFARERFIEVETPFRVPAPGVDLHLDAVRAHGGYLITSPELQMKRLLVAGFSRIFQLSRVSRRDESGSLHEPEFTMLEWYRAFAGLEQVLSDTEQLLVEVAQGVSGSPLLYGADGRTFVLEPPFQRITVREAFLEHAGIADAVDLAHSDEARYFELLVALVEPGLARESKPLFLWQYPANQAALARLSANDPSVAERFELYVGGVELCNGFDELTSESEQRVRFERECVRRHDEGRPVYPIDDRFLTALTSGMPPSGGNALGFDRLVMLATGARELSQVIAFPARYQ